MYQIKIIFRTDKNTGLVTAFFPDISANPGCIVSYEHLGQHAESDYGYYYENKRKATEEEYKGLFQELNSIYEGQLKIIWKKPKNKSWVY